MLYVPRGPLVDWDDVPRSMAVAQDLQLLAKKSRAIFIKMDPEIITGAGIPGVEGETVNRSGEDVAAQIQRLGWRYSQEQVQFRNTVWLDLSGGEEDWLARMKQKNALQPAPGAAERGGGSPGPGERASSVVPYVCADLGARWLCYPLRRVLPEAMALFHGMRPGRVTGCRGGWRGSRGAVPFFLCRESVVFIRHVVAAAPRENAELFIAMGSHAPCKSQGLRDL
jgi:hypothetical protein